MKKLSNSVLITFLISQLLLPYSVMADVGAPCDKPFAPSNRTEQKKTYCEAAKMSDKAADAQKQTAIAWGVVTAVCSTACAMASTGVFSVSELTYGKYCSYASIGATGFDIIKTIQAQQDFQGTVKDLLGAGGMAANQIINKGVNAAGRKLASTMAASPEIKDAARNANQKASCWSAGIAGATTVMKYMSFKDSNKVKEENIEKAQILEDSLGVIAESSPTPGPSLVAAGSSSGGTSTGINSDGSNSTFIDTTSRSSGTSSGTQSGSTSGAATAAMAPRNSCASWNSNPNVGSFGSCATAGDTEIVKIMQMPEFKSDIKKLSGKSFEDLVKSIPNDFTPESVMAATLANVSNPILTKNNFAKANKKFEVSIENTLRNDPKYASKPMRASLADSSTAVSSPGFKISEMTTKPDLSIKDILTREPSNVKTEIDNEVTAENSKINLFSRVGNKYRQVHPRLTATDYTLPFNQQVK